MKRLIRILFFLMVSLCAMSQEPIFESNLQILGKDSLVSKKIEVIPRIFISNNVDSRNEFSNTYLIGLDFDAVVNRQLVILGQYDHLSGSYNSEIIKYKDSLGVYPGFGMGQDRLQFNIKYNHSKFINTEFGIGKQFIGRGYHSLLLSDFGGSYPYLKVITEFGRVRYYNLYTTFLNPDLVDFGRKKHATIHYLDYAITDNINVGVFESVLWQSKLEEVERGYELAYLNPVIFYRPVEFSKHSNKANVLMGANLSLRYKDVLLYGQFLLDDLNVSRQRDSDGDYSSGFFQNKFAYQIGLKGQLQKVEYLFEYNQVQPYTYAHKTVLQNYSHMNQALGHPLGANFKEFVNIVKINHDNWIYKFKSMFVMIGMDSLHTHYGQDIFQSDYDATTGGEYSYGNYNGQGVATTMISLQTEISYQFDWVDVFGAIYYRHQMSDLLQKDIIFYSIGMRTCLFSSFYNY